MDAKVICTSNYGNYLLVLNLCDLPKLGEKVYYFPQGHMEIFEASIKEDLNQMKPFFDLPSKILCRVIAIKLKAEKDTDEVSAEITLIPDSTQVITHIHNDVQEKPIVHSFTKVLTSSDTSPNSVLTIRKEDAIECLPPLDMSQHIPAQGLIAKDIHDHEWRFEHILSSTQQQHIFSDGWSAFVSAKRLVAGDCFVFLREENGELRVGIRRAEYQQGHIPSRVLSTQTMHPGEVASVVHAFSNKCMFIVVYKPRFSQFVISYEKFVDAVNNKFSVGSRFMMRFEGENFSEIRYSGTVIGTNNFSPYWKDSEWRSLQVQWDEHASFTRPHNVSPWEIVYLEPSTSIPQSLFFKEKRSRQVHEIGSTSLNLWTPELNQSQEIGITGMNTMMIVPNFSCRDHVVEDSKALSGSLMSCPISTMSEPNYNNDQIVLPTNEKTTSDATTSFRLFGVDMSTPSHTKDPKGPSDLHQKSKSSIVSEEVERMHLNSTRSRIKVQMQGVTIVRSLDLTVIDGYNQLIDELEKLFDIKGQLRTPDQWKIVFTDDEGDMMVVGDDPWHEFCHIVKKIFICSKEEVTKIKSEDKFG